MSVVIGLAVIVVGLVLFDLAALAYGADSRPSLDDERRS